MYFYKVQNKQNYANRSQDSGYFGGHDEQIIQGTSAVLVTCIYLIWVLVCLLN